jgi:hypothetical protein
MNKHGKLFAIAAAIVVVVVVALGVANANHTNYTTARDKDYIYYTDHVYLAEQPSPTGLSIVPRMLGLDEKKLANHIALAQSACGKNIQVLITRLSGDCHRDLSRKNKDATPAINVLNDQLKQWKGRQADQAITIVIAKDRIGHFLVAIKCPGHAVQGDLHCGFVSDLLDRALERTVAIVTDKPFSLPADETDKISTYNGNYWRPYRLYGYRPYYGHSFGIETRWFGHGCGHHGSKEQRVVGRPTFPDA